ncbi:MAG: tripartite tricarboxylate transporter substrate binding protein [Betaproteobacteria bacterium]|nr:tripartite tricarboxylate transporter substrate binding protein [Betaproteobacteria bacterium]
MNVRESKLRGPALRLRAVVCAAVALAGGIFAWPALGQSYPVRPVRLIIPFPPGGATDAVGRTFAAKFTEAWGQQVIVDNRPGANTIVAAELTARAAPDGYTLFLTTAATQVNNVLLYRKLPYDARKSFQLISMTTVLPYAFAAHPSLPANSIRELVALAKARPGQLSYGSSGIGSSGHLAGVLFDTMTGTKMVHVPYKGAAAAIIDLIGGQIPLYLPTMTSIAPHMRSRKVKVLGIATAKRHPSWPDIGTVAEAGYPGYEMNTWYGLVAPAGIPRAIVDRVHAETVRVAKLPDVIERMKTLGADLHTNTPVQFAAYIERDFRRVGKAVEAAGLRLD